MKKYIIFNIIIILCCLAIGLLGLLLHGIYRNKVSYSMHSGRNNDTYQIGSWPFGPLNAVAVKKNICYVPSGGVIVLWDISKNRPVNIKSIVTKGIVMDAKVDKDFLYIAAGSAGVKIFSIANPESPVPVATVPSEDWSSAVMPVGNYLYMADAQGGLRIADISNIYQPKEIARLRIRAVSVRSVAVYGKYAYLSCGISGFYIVDISNPYRPKTMSHFSVKDKGATALRITVRDHYAYLACRTSNVYVFDVSNPLRPKAVSKLSVKGAITDVVIHNNLAYVASFGAGLYILDISNPYQLEEVAMVATILVKNVFLSQDSVYLSCDDAGGLCIFNITNPYDPKEIANIMIGFGEISDVVINKNYAYLANDDELGGMHILDVSDTSKLQVVSQINNIKEKIDSIFSRDDFLYLVCEKSGIYIFDISNPFQPKEISKFTIKGTIRALSVYDNLAYIVCDPSDIYIFDISNPFQPSNRFHTAIIDDDDKLRAITTKEELYGTFFVDNRCYIGIDHFLYILDFHESDKIVRINKKIHYELLDRARGIFVVKKGIYSDVYVADDDAGLQILRVDF